MPKLKPLNKSAKKIPKKIISRTRLCDENNITQTEYAKRRGVSGSTINTMVKSGIIKLTARKLIDPVQADKALADTVDLTRPSSKLRMTTTGVVASQDPARGTIVYWRRVDLQLRASLRQLEHDERIGKLVLQEDELAKGYEAAKRVRDGLWQMIDRLSALLAGESDENKVRDMLVHEVTQVCEELARES